MSITSRKWLVSVALVASLCVVGGLTFIHLAGGHGTQDSSGGWFTGNPGWSIPPLVTGPSGGGGANAARWPLFTDAELVETTAVYVASGYAYVALSDRIVVYDVTQPAAPAGVARRASVPEGRS